MPRLKRVLTAIGCMAAMASGKTVVDPLPPTPEPTGESGCDYIAHCTGYKPGADAAQPHVCICAMCEDAYAVSADQSACVEATPAPTPAPPAFTPLCPRQVLPAGIYTAGAVVGVAADGVLAVQFDVQVPNSQWAGLGLYDPALVKQGQWNGMAGLDVVVADPLHAKVVECATTPMAGKWVAGGRPEVAPGGDAVTLLSVSQHHSQASFLFMRKLQNAVDAALPLDTPVDFAFASGPSPFESSFHGHTDAERRVEAVTILSCAETLPYQGATPAPPPGPFGCDVIPHCDLYGPGPDPQHNNVCVCGQCDRGYTQAAGNASCAAVVTPRNLGTQSATTGTETDTVSTSGTAGNASATVAATATVEMSSSDVTMTTVDGNDTATGNGTMSGGLGNQSQTTTAAGSHAAPVNATTTTPASPTAGVSHTSATGTASGTPEGGSTAPESPAAEDGEGWEKYADVIFGAVAFVLLVCCLVWACMWYMERMRPDETWDAKMAKQLPDSWDYEPDFETTIYKSPNQNPIAAPAVSQTLTLPKAPAKAVGSTPSQAESSFVSMTHSDATADVLNNTTTGGFPSRKAVNLQSRRSVASSRPGSVYNTPSLSHLSPALAHLTPTPAARRASPSVDGSRSAQNLADTSVGFHMPPAAASQGVENADTSLASLNHTGTSFNPYTQTVRRPHAHAAAMASQRRPHSVYGVGVPALASTRAPHRRRGDAVVMGAAPISPQQSTRGTPPSPPPLDLPAHVNPSADHFI
eukprot:TRINITY_DN15362_c0_g1_i1.p1 TRINITY_DN15362_c0_g1~~TRINITY_DN15362_c0_g1_i1.p1  ORF type:complete len:752 (+),score=131.94 TRINITY_DN15362_c0_g1_i1:37-2292(+)